ncbi:MAG: hypothetical protein JNK15_16870 [Planctomycetes bacterium]|nr:hypothetical protein [Planctomycetota bacterium]
MKPFLRCVGASLFGALLLAQEPARQAPQAVGAPAVQAASKRYETNAWPRGAVRAGVDLAAIVLPGFAGGAIERLGPGPVQRFFADAGRVDRVLVEVHVGDDVDAAQRHLLGWLAHVSSPGLVPTSASAGIPLGDVGFIGWSKPSANRIAWLAFVRDNVAVRVVCLDPSVDPHPDLAACAQLVDAAVGREALVAAKALPPRPDVTMFRAERATCRAGDKVPLAVGVDVAAGAATLRFEVDGPGQGYVEGDGKGGHVLCTTGPGRVTVRLVATGARCTSTTTSVQVDVGPR